MLKDQFEGKMEKLELLVELEESHVIDNIKTNLLNMKDNVRKQVEK